jgi:hypothetical protein
MGNRVLIGTGMKKPPVLKNLKDIFLRVRLLGETSLLDLNLMTITMNDLHGN